jgi:hypothetical protein
MVRNKNGTPAQPVSLCGRLCYSAAASPPDHFQPTVIGYVPTSPKLSGCKANRAEKGIYLPENNLEIDCIPTNQINAAFLFLPL